MSRTNKNARGFSVLEVLIAIAILAGIAMALAPAVGAAARASARIHEGAAARETLRTAGAFFRETVQQAISIGTDAPEYYFVGDATALQFPTVDAERADPVLIRFEIDGGSPQKLVVSGAWLGEEAGKPQTHVALDGIASGAFAFYGGEEKEPASWRGEWNGALAPRLIRFSGVLKTARGDRPFSFEAAPASEALLNCRFDPVSRVCR